MTAFEKGALIGSISGAVAGALLCKPYGMLAEIGGVVGGGVVGFFAGSLAIYPYAFIYAAARIYWEVLTGRRKLPRASGRVERRWLLRFFVAILIVSAVIYAYLYLAGSPAQQSRVPLCAGLSFGLSFLGLLILVAHHRRCPPQERGGRDG